MVLLPGLQFQCSLFPRYLESVWIFLIVSLYNFHSINANPGSNCEFRAHQAESWHAVQQHVVELQEGRTHVKKKENEDRGKWPILKVALDKNSREYHTFYVRKIT